MVEVPNRPEYQSELFKKGLAVRREVLGARLRGCLAGPRRRFQRRLPADDHRDRLGHVLDPPRHRPQDPQHDQPDDAVGAEPRLRTAPASARRR